MTDEDRYRALVDLWYERFESGDVAEVIAGDLIAMVPGEQQEAWGEVIAKSIALTQFMAELDEQTTALSQAPTELNEHGERGG